MKCEAVQRMDDGLDACHARRDSSQDPCFRRVRMDDVVPPAFHEAIELEEGEEIVQRADWPHQTGKDLKRHSSPPRGIMKVPLRSGIGSREEGDFHPKPTLSDGGKKGIFLGAAHDEPRDHVENAKRTAGRVVVRFRGKGVPHANFELWVVHFMLPRLDARWPKSPRHAML
jgi:hypothetical protein